jgi:hypothetical protein
MYPSILRRYLSTTIDLVLIAALTYAFLKSPFFSPEDSESPLWLFLGLVACEPLLTAFACTPGQFLMNLRVKNAKTLGRPSLLSTVARSLVKVFLGVISIIFNPQSKAETWTSRSCSENNRTQWIGPIFVTTWHFGGARYFQIVVSRIVSRGQSFLGRWVMQRTKANALSSIVRRL